MKEPEHLVTAQIIQKGKKYFDLFFFNMTLFPNMVLGQQLSDLMIHS